MSSPSHSRQDPLLPMSHLTEAPSACSSTSSSPNHKKASSVCKASLPTVTHRLPTPDRQEDLFSSFFCSTLEADYSASPLNNPPVPPVLPWNFRLSRFPSILVSWSGPLMALAGPSGQLDCAMCQLSLGLGAASPALLIKAHLSPFCLSATKPCSVLSVLAAWEYFPSLSPALFIFPFPDLFLQFIQLISPAFSQPFLT